MADQEPKSKKLYDALKGDGLYTKDFSDFQEQFSTPDKVGKLYESLKKDGLYTKSQEEFTDQFFEVPKKDPEVSGQESANTSQTSTRLSQTSQGDSTDLLGRPVRETPSPTDVNELEGTVDVEESARLAREMNQPTDALGRSISETPSILTEQGVEQYQDIKAKEDAKAQALSDRLDHLASVNQRVTKEELYEAIEARPEDSFTRVAEKDNIAKELFQSVDAGYKRLRAGIGEVPALVFDTMYAWAGPERRALAVATNSPSLLNEDAQAFRQETGFLDEPDAETQLINIQLDLHQQEMEAKYGTSVTEAFSEGRYSDGARLLANQVAETIPMMVAIGATGGGAATIGVGGTILAGGKYAEIQDNPEVGTEAKIVNAFLSGASEFAFERLGTGTILRTAESILKQSGKEAAEEFTKKTFSEMFEGAMKKYFVITAPLAEGFEETANQFTENVVDRITGVDPERDLMSGLLDSFVVGAAAGSAVSTPVSVFNKVTSRETKTKVDELVKENNDIASMDGSVDEAQAKILGEKYIANNEAINDLLEQDRQAQESLPEETQEEINSYQERIDTIDGLVENEDTPETVKESLNREKDVLLESIEELVPVQQTEEISDAEQTEITEQEGGVTDTDVADIPTEAETTTPEVSEVEFTQEETERIGNVLTNPEARKQRIAELGASLTDYWTNLGNEGIVPNQGRQFEQFNKAVRDLVEYAALTIADGTIKTAQEFRNLITNNGQIQIDEAITNKAFDDAQKSFVEASVAEQTTTQQVDRATEGGIQGTETITSKQELANQIKTLQTGIRVGIVSEKRGNTANQTRINEVKKTLTGYIDSFKNTDLFKGVEVPARLVPRLIKKLNSATSRKTVEGQVNALYDFSEYLEKVVKDVEFDNKATKAQSEASKIDRVAKSSTFKKQTTVAPLIRELAQIGKNPAKITDIDAYLDIATNAVDSKGNINVSNEALNDYLGKEREAQVREASRRETERNQLEKERQIAHIQSLLDAAGIEGNPEDYYQANLTYEEGFTEAEIEEEGAERPTIAEQLETIINENRKGLPNGKGVEGRDARLLEALKNQDLSQLETADLRKFNAVINNVILNGDYLTGTVDILGRYEAAEVFPEWSKEYESELKKVREGTSERHSSLAPNKIKLDTEQLIRNMFATSGTVGRSLYNHILGGVDRGAVAAKKFIDKSVNTALNIYDKNKMKVQDSYDVWFAQYVLDFDTNGELSRQESFENRKNLIKLGIEEIDKNLKQRGANLLKVERQQLERDRKGMQASLNKARQFPILEQFQENFLNEPQRLLYDHMLNTWESKRDETEAHFKKLGVKFSEIDLYYPISYKKIRTERIDIDSDLWDSDSYIRPGAVDSEGKHVAERQDVRRLPVRKSDDGVAVLYPNIHSMLTFDKNLSRRLADIETIEARSRAKYILKDPRLKELLDNVDPKTEEPRFANHEVLEWKVKTHIRDLTGISAFVSDYTYQLDGIINLATRTFYRGAVGSFTQVINQSIPNIPAIWANTSVGAWTQASNLMRQSLFNGGGKIKALMEASNASTLNRVDDSAEQRQQNVASDMENEQELKLSSGAQKVNEKIGEFVYRGLTAGDNINSFNTWMSGYIHSLKDQGIIKRSSEFNLDMLEEHTKNPNKRAQEFADGVTSSVNATVRKASRAEATKSRTTAQRILNAAFGMPLKSFATSMNMEARIAFRNLMTPHRTARDFALVGAYIANVAVLSNLTRYGWSLAFQYGGQVLSGALLGAGGDDDERAKAEERRLADLGLTKEEESKVKNNRKAWSMLATTIGNILFGSKPAWIESWVTFGIDKAYQQLILENFDKAKTKEEKARSYYPRTLFYSSEDNVFGAGVLDQYGKIVTSAEKVFTGAKPIDEEAARKLTIMRALDAAFQTGIGGADIKRLVQQTTYDMEKIVKDGYYKMSNKYGVIKEAVNSIGIEALTPYAEGVLYISDDAGNAEQISLSDDEVSEINRDIGKEMVRLLPEVGYGRNLKSFNKNNYSIERINSDMTKLKGLALKNVIRNKYGKERITKNLYQKLMGGDE